MWVVADLKKLKEAVSSQPVSIIRATETISPAGAPKTGTMETPAETTVTAPTAKPVPTQASTPTQVPTPTPVETRQQEIKTKLKYLKELLDEGLISEKDYNAKKMQLLDKID
jgi:hypothetical protein